MSLSFPVSAYPIISGKDNIFHTYLRIEPFVLGQNPGRDYKLMFSRDADGKIAALARSGVTGMGGAVVHDIQGLGRQRGP